MQSHSRRGDARSICHIATPNIHAWTNRRARWFVASPGMPSPTTLRCPRPGGSYVESILPCPSGVSGSRRSCTAADTRRLPIPATKTLPPMCPRRAAPVAPRPRPRGDAAPHACTHPLAAAHLFICRLQRDGQQHQQHLKF